MSSIIHQVAGTEEAEEAGFVNSVATGGVIRVCGIGSIRNRRSLSDVKY